MKTPLLLAGAGLLGLAAPTLQDLAYGPEEGTTLTKTFETTMDMGLDDMMLTFNGQDIDPAMMGADLSEASGSVSVVVEVEDEYGPSKDGRPSTLTRRFETIMAEYEGGNGESGAENDGDLEGATLTFTWDEEEEAYKVVASDESLDMTEISHGGMDMDLLGMLPGKAVEEDDSWKVQGDALMTVLWPGLDWLTVKEKVSEGMAEAEVPVDVEELFAALVEQAVITCTYTGEREMDGTTLQVIELEAEVAHTMELGDAILELIRAEAPTELDMELVVSVELAAELEGLLLWNSAAGHFHDCNMDIDIALLAEGEVEADIQGNPMSGSAEVEFSGTLRRRASAR